MQHDNTVMHRTPSLENMHAQLSVQAVGRVQPQGRCRGFVLCRFWPEQEHQTVAPLGADLKTANLFLARLRKPGQNRTRSIGPDELFSDPQPLCRGIGLNPDQVALVQPFMGQARQVRMLGGGAPRSLGLPWPPLCAVRVRSAAIPAPRVAG